MHSFCVHVKYIMIPRFGECPKFHAIYTAEAAAVAAAEKEDDDDENVENKLRF